jgi:hypothetical protein
MYACILETGRGFFEWVCTPSSTTANLHDPPPPRNAKEPEPHGQGSGPKRITRRPTVNGDLAWGRRRLPPAHCQNTARRPPTKLDIVHTPLKASQAGALLVGTRSLGGHDHAKISSTSWSKRSSTLGLIRPLLVAQRR